MKRLFKHFTTDMRPCGCSRLSSAPKCDKCTAKRSPTTDTKPTKAKVSNDATHKPRVDLNEIHRRFWNRLAGKE
jgi:hypothetical protein